MPRRSAEFIPTAPAELTAEWVAVALRRAGITDDADVAEVTVEPLRTGGVGMTGETVRVRVRCDHDDVPETLVAKFPAPDAKTKGLMETYDSYAREIRFYQRFAARLPVRTPRYFGADYDPGSSKQPGPVGRRIVDALPAPVMVWISKNTTKYMRASKRRYALLIEDMGSEGTIHDLAHPPSIDQIGTALETFAAIHAAFWGDPALADDDALDTIVTSTPGLYSTVARVRSLPIAIERYDWLGDAEADLFREASHRFAHDLELINRPQTLVHGDTRSDNLMFAPDGSVILLDWALAAHGNPAWDVGYLLSSCVDPSDASALDALVDRYETALRSGGVDIDGAELRRGIEAAFRMVAVVNLLSLAVLDGNEQLTGAELADQWLPRTAAAMAHRWA